MLTLTVSHNLFLTRQQRYELCQTDVAMEVVGVSVPVWFLGGRTSEPAREVFAKYILSITDNSTAIKRHSEGYIINLPKTLSNVERSVAQLLMDPEDGGQSMIQYKEYSNGRYKKNAYRAIHTVEIYDMSVLEDSLC